MRISLEEDKMMCIARDFIAFLQITVDAGFSCSIIYPLNNNKTRLKKWLKKRDEDISTFFTYYFLKMQRNIEFFIFLL